jgi:hypothetical protein
MSANKRITTEQFTDGSTIDGTRIEKAYDDTYQKLNNIDKNDLKQIFVPRTIYTGWQTAHFSETEESPDEQVFPLGMFMPLYNSFDRDVVGVTGGRTEVNNKWRWKGTQIFNAGAVATPAGSHDIATYNGTDVVGRTFSFYFEKPCIITDISIIWEVDNYTGLNREPPFEGDLPSNIERSREQVFWWGQCYLDSVMFPEDKEKGSIVWRRTQSSDSADDVTGQRLPRSDKRAFSMIPRAAAPNSFDFLYDRSTRVPVNDFRPNDYQNSLVGPSPTNTPSNHPLYQHWWDKNLNIPIPQQSRIHFGLGCAIESTPSGSFLVFQDDSNFHRGYRFNLAVGILETIEE